MVNSLFFIFIEVFLDFDFTFSDPMDMGPKATEFIFMHLLDIVSVVHKEPHMYLECHRYLRDGPDTGVLVSINISRFRRFL